jgi:hypothetical protein
MRTKFSYNPNTVRCPECIRGDDAFTSEFTRRREQIFREAQDRIFRETGMGDSFFGSQEKQKTLLVKESIPPEMLKRLIMLCHPDKHNNSEMSRIATDWLLKEKEKQNG